MEGTTCTTEVLPDLTALQKMIRRRYEQRYGQAYKTAFQLFKNVTTKITALFGTKVFMAYNGISPQSTEQVRAGAKVRRTHQVASLSLPRLPQVTLAQEKWPSAPFMRRRQWHPTPVLFCLENPMDGGAWWAAVHGVPGSQTRLSGFTFTFPFHALEKEMATHSSVLAWRIPGTGEPGGLPSMGSHRVGHD